VAKTSCNAAANHVTASARAGFYLYRLSQTAIDALDHWVDYMPVDLVSNFAGEMRRPVRHALTRKCGCALDAEKRHAHGRGENQAFHLFIPSFYIS
jgi:hypothetical protein